MLMKILIRVLESLELHTLRHQSGRRNFRIPVKGLKYLIIQSIKNTCEMMKSTYRNEETMDEGQTTLKLRHWHTIVDRRQAIIIVERDIMIKKRHWHTIVERRH